MKSYTKESFEEYLQRKHMEDEPTVLDDDLPEAYETWLEGQGVDLLIAYAGVWHSEQLLAYIDSM